MMPLYLEMQAFGPYAEKQVIDFRKLGTRRLFLICGPTGAGKTTVLDAMCYALYGDTSGNRRSGTHMRSEYAAPTLATKVSFSFAVGTKYYRIERSPEQEIAKIRGKGLKKAAAAVAFYETDGQGKDTAVLATKNVNAKVEEILGFKSDQFRQVVLFPQGDFRRLLLANSTERQQIMQVLFHTQRYARFQELAKERYDALQQEYQTLEEQNAQALAMVSVATPEELTEYIRQGKDKCRVITEAIAVKKKEINRIQVQLTQAKRLDEHFKILDNARKEEEKLAAQAAAMELRKKNIERIEQAQGLTDACNYLQDIIERGKQAARAGEEADRQVEAAERQAAKAVHTYQQWADKKDLYRQYGERSVQLQLWLPKAAGYESLCREVEIVRQEARDREEAIEKEAATLIRYKERLQAAQRAAQEAAAIKLALQQQKVKIIRLQEEAQKAQLRESLRTRIQTQQAAADAIKEQLQAAKQAAEDATCMYERAHCLFIQGQASILAKTLTDGTPCPVCGATAHPQPALPTAWIPAEEEVEDKKKTAHTAQQQWQACKLAYEKACGNLESLQTQYTEAPMPENDKKTSAQWQQEIQDGELLGKQWEKSLRQQEIQAKEAPKWETCVAEQEKKVQDCRQQQVQWATKVSRKETEKQQMEAEIPASYRLTNKITSEIHTLQTKQAEYEENLRRAEERKNEAARSVEGAKGKAKERREQYKYLQDVYKKEEPEVRQRVQAAGFADIAACKVWQQKQVDLKKEKEWLQQYTDRRQEIIGIIKQEQTMIQGKSRPDPEIQQKQYDAGENDLHVLIKQQAEYKQQVQQAEEIYQKIAARHKRQQELMDQYKVVGGLYELISGKQTGINFERYVLGALLDEVLRAANLRLQTMSRQRYELQRSVHWEDKRTRQIGLDIAVFDHYTGYARPANTLSGGETFLASLSLALGLADVVQAYSGGIHLDTIFIDEGFGTLDGETLDFALKTLLQLQGDGRLVGIISHVPELRERITTRLIITKSDRGSAAAFELL